MAIQNIKREGAGSELFRLFRGIFAEMHRETRNYAFAISNGDTVAARMHIITALSKAKIVRQRVSNWYTRFTLAELTECINVVTDSVTLAELDEELSTIETYCQNLYDRYMSEEITLAEVAGSLYAQCEDIMDYIAFANLTGLTDIEGNEYTVG